MNYSAEKSETKSGFYLGTVRFSGFGGYRERMLSDILAREIPIRNVKFSDVEISGEVSPLDYCRTAEIARKNGVRIRSGRRQGLYFTLMRYSRRVGLYVGALVFVLVLSLWKTHVQDISITGDVPKSQVLDILDEYNIRVGSPITGLRLSEAEHRLMLDIENCAWVDVSCEGFRVNVNVQKGTEMPEIYGTAPRNLVAARPAKIVSQKVKNGESVVSNGSGVDTGDMLVSGIMPDGGERFLTVRAEAEIIGEWEESAEFFVPYEEDVSLANGDKHEFKYLVFGDDVYPLFLGKAKVENALYSEETRVIRLFGEEIPLKLRIGTYTEYQKQHITRSPETAVSELKKQQQTYQENFFSEYDIIKCEEKYYPQEDGVYLILDYTLRGDITTPVDIEFADTGEDAPPPDTQSQPES